MIDDFELDLDLRAEQEPAPAPPPAAAAGRLARFLGTVPPTDTSAPLAGVLGFICPGLGHFYVGHIKLAVAITLGTGVVSAAFSYVQDSGLVDPQLLSSVQLALVVARFGIAIHAGVVDVGPDGPQSLMRRFLYFVVASTLLCGSMVWNAASRARPLGDPGPVVTEGLL